MSKHSLNLVVGVRFNKLQYQTIKDVAESEKLKPAVYLRKIILEKIDGVNDGKFSNT